MTDWTDEVEPIHAWFGLTYANYLVLNRALLQLMPQDWQARFVACLEELSETAEAAGVTTARQFSVQCRGYDGRFERDPIPHYNRGRTRIDLEPK